MSAAAIPIYIVIGTRGQFTKTAPVMRELASLGVPYTLINTGQHTVSSQQIARIFGLQAADHFITRRAKDIETLSEALCWFMQALFRLLLQRRRFFPHGRGLVIIHGDTLSTLLALLGARAARMPVAHIESGLRSHSLLHPFPEEIIRILACRGSDLLFAPSAESCRNLGSSRAVSFNTDGNTVFDAIEFVSGRSPDRLIDARYCVATIHRSEVLFRDDLFKIALSAVYKAAATLTVVFVVHQATMARLAACGELSTIRNHPRITIQDYYDYPSFMKLVRDAQFVLTDGGGLQEETYCLNVPCLILRKRTERSDGLGTTAFLSELKTERIDFFLSNYRNFRRGPFHHPHASRFIARKIAEYTCAHS